MILHHAEVAVLLAIFLTIRGTQKHRAQNPRIVFRKIEGRSSLQAFPESGCCNQSTYPENAVENRLKTSRTAKVRLRSLREIFLGAQSAPPGQAGLFTTCSVFHL